MLADYDYDLPADRIAQFPATPRDAARLLCLSRDDGRIEDTVFRDLADRLGPDDLLVVNETRVSAVRLFGVKAGTETSVEALLLRPVQNASFSALVRPGRRLKTGDTIDFADADLTASVGEATHEGGRVLHFAGDTDDVLARLDAHGRVPLPPYITAPLADPARYQTVYARTPGSAAAPTAGLHFTPELLATIRARGVATATIRLDVGLGTFRPIKTENLDEHIMHCETFAVPEETAAAVNTCTGRVVAVGTTTLRALESAALCAPAGHRITAVAAGETDLFVRPGFSFRAVDALITNFHQPHSTLLLLVGAFAGREPMRRAYDHALATGYRFLSFGDALFIE